MKGGRGGGKGVKGREGEGWREVRVLDMNRLIITLSYMPTLHQFDIN